MAKPVILAVGDDPQVLRAVQRDLRHRYAREYAHSRWTEPTAHSGTEATIRAIDEVGPCFLSQDGMPGDCQGGRLRTLEGLRVVAPVGTRCRIARETLWTATAFLGPV